MTKTLKFDFSGYATKSGLKCTDGRTILKDAFKHQDGQTVPLVWQHIHNEPTNILGHAILEHRDDGVYCYGIFNNSPNAQQAKELILHGDIKALSIYANQLTEKTKQVSHGSIREVSLVLSGANPGAKIENVSFAHGDDGSWIDDETEAFIYNGFNVELMHSDDEEESEESESTDESSKEEAKDMEHASKDGLTIGEVFDTFTDEQKEFIYHMLGAALNGAADQEESETDDVQHSDNNEGDSQMKKNVFDKSTETEAEAKKHLTHSQLMEIVGDAKRYGSLKESFLAHAADYGFEPVDYLFPDAKDVASGAPYTVKREMGWVDDFLKGATHTPFSRIRTRFADITADAARAKGYVTGNLKDEQVITLSKRTTTPTTIYIKQKLDRDDMVDITDFDVVVWLKAEMRLLLDEEMARAGLLGDGRSVADDDKINEGNIRPIISDDPNFYIQRVQVAADETIANIIDEIIKSRKYYKGSGNPTCYMGTDLLTDMLLLKDQFGHYMYKTATELASVLRVSKIVEVEIMNSAVRVSGDDQFAIKAVIVNPKDYTFGADKGGQVGMFDDFDIDYNQYKYLMEGRASGALTMPKSAIVIEALPAV